LLEKGAWHFRFRCAETGSYILLVCVFVCVLAAVASLLNLNVHFALRLLFSRRTQVQFNCDSLLVVLPIYFVLCCWAAGSAVASGIVIPML